VSVEVTSARAGVSVKSWTCHYVMSPDILMARTLVWGSGFRRDWTDFFIATDIAGAPAFLGADLFDDDHARARRLIYEQAQPDGTSQRLIGTCIKSKPDERFAPPAAPHVGQHTEELLTVLADYDAAGMERLRSSGAI